MIGVGSVVLVYFIFSTSLLPNETFSRQSRFVSHVQYSPPSLPPLPVHFIFSFHSLLFICVCFVSFSFPSNFKLQNCGCTRCMIVPSVDQKHLFYLPLPSFHPTSQFYPQLLTSPLLSFPGVMQGFPYLVDQSRLQLPVLPQTG